MYAMLAEAVHWIVYIVLIVLALAMVEEAYHFVKEKE
jgi:hypothetical protein